jgi:ubiquinone/menaquinone biosynthesis C-methylase UbiE
VLDLGAGAGVDAFVARRLVGEKGQVYGVDMTPDMVAKARANAERLGYRNVESRLGEIERLPFERDTLDVVISNCVLNLVPEKARAFAEIYRVLRPGAHFCVSDIVASAPLPEGVRNAAALYVGCIAGAEPEADYLAIIANAGFRDVRIVKSRRIDLPDEALAGTLAPDDLAAAREADLHVRSVTVVGVKPAS